MAADKALKREPVHPARQRHEERQPRARGQGKDPGRDRDSIETHLTIVFAALAVSRWIEAQTGWSIRKFVRSARRYRTIIVVDPSPPNSARPSTASSATQVRVNLS